MRRSGSIVFDARYVRERPSGIGAMVDELVRRLPALLPSERFHFLRHPAARTPLSSAPNATEETVRAEANGPGTLFQLPLSRSVRAAKLFFAPANILPFRVPCPSIVTVHDLMWLDSPELCRSPGPWGVVETAFYQAGLGNTLRSATAIVCPSHATKEAIAQRSSRAAGRTTVVPHGVDDAFRHGIQGDLPSDDDAGCKDAMQRHVPGARRYVLTVGQAAGYKNHDGVLRAFAEAFPHDDGTHLVFVQRLGAESGRLRAMARTLGVHARVHVLPTLPFGDLLALLRGAICLCHPSFVEGWGMPITEALAAGCPVLTSTTSCMPEVTGGAAELVEPTSTHSIALGLRRLASEPERREALRVLGLSRAAQLLWTNTAARTAEVFAQVLDARH